MHADGIARIKRLRLRRRGGEQGGSDHDQAERKAHGQYPGMPRRTLMHLLVALARRRLVEGIIGVEIAAGRAARGGRAALRQRGEGAVEIVAAAATEAAGRIDVHAHRVARIIGLGAGIGRNEQRGNGGEGQNRQAHGLHPRIGGAGVSDADGLLWHNTAPSATVPRDR